MDKRRKTKIVLALLLVVAVLISVYSISAYCVASFVIEYNGVLVWPTPGYSFLPWPTTPTGLMIQLIEPLNQVDVQYYRFIVQSGLLAGLTFLAWLAVAWQIMRFKKTSSFKQG